MAIFTATQKSPEESAFHTALCNLSDLRICRDNKRYIDWNTGGSQPKWLEISDVPQILALGALFARDYIDRAV